MKKTEVGSFAAKEILTTLVKGILLLIGLVLVSCAQKDKETPDPDQYFIGFSYNLDANQPKILFYDTFTMNELIPYIMETSNILIPLKIKTEENTYNCILDKSYFQLFLSRNDFARDKIEKEIAKCLLEKKYFHISERLLKQYYADETICLIYKPDNCKAEIKKEYFKGRKNFVEYSFKKVQSSNDRDDLGFIIEKLFYLKIPFHIECYSGSYGIASLIGLDDDYFKFMDENGLWKNENINNNK